MVKKLSVLWVVLLAAPVSLHAIKGELKNKKGVVLKFNGFNLKSNNSFSLFSKLGFLYKGSFLNNSTTEKTPQVPQNAHLNSIITLQKGNATFIYPYRYKVSVPLFKTPTPPISVHR